MNSHTHKNASSVAIDLENLQQQYANLLIKYKQSVVDYVDNLKNEEGIDASFISIQGMAYPGTGSAGQSTATTLQDCEASCSTNSSCKGATFISGKCNIRTGDSTIVPTNNDSYAIIPKSKQLLMHMEDLNKQLLNVNREIKNKIQIGQPTYDEVKKESYEKSIQLIEDYKELEKERENINELLKQYETLETTENANEVKITQNYYIYILSFILVIAVVFLLIKISMPTNVSTIATIQQGGNNTTISCYALFATIIVVVGSTFLMKY